jgi:hypothetical protein
LALGASHDDPVSSLPAGKETEHQEQCYSTKRPGHLRNKKPLGEVASPQEVFVAAAPHRCEGRLAAYGLTNGKKIAGRTAPSSRPVAKPSSSQCSGPSNPLLYLSSFAAHCRTWVRCCFVNELLGDFVLKKFSGAGKRTAAGDLGVRFPAPSDSSGALLCPGKTYFLTIFPQGLCSVNA